MGKLLRVALLCHPTVGGSGILATELGHRLADLGHEVFIISERPPFRMQDDYPRVHFCESTPVEFPLFKSPDHTLPLATRIAEVCSQYEIDVVHAHYAIPHAAAAWIARELIGLAAPPIVTTLHGTDIVYLGAMPEYRLLLQHVLEASDKVTCVSENLKQRTLALFELKKKIDVIPNFFEPKTVVRSREQIRVSLDIGDEPLAIHASNLRLIKRVDLLLAGFQSTVAEHDGKLLILAGADSSRILPEIERYSLTDRVIVIDDVYEVDDYYAASDFTVYSSEYESFCLGILEGMRHGLPSVSFDVGGIPEVVEDGETGFLVPFEDTDRLGQAIARLAQDGFLRYRMGDRAKRRAVEMFSASTVVESYLAAYRDVLA
ncbi:MAG: N-acetyl-alpha-D-glucosaminyl L-malate synthase BshA [Opitutales bacterium]|nr:N-acetyl-alpha-D-glucosaminyl L-malate synthase BshA [Opitutales bacterium]MBT5169226.1 N-acetyl-alpha-D-glucosaminyl L-malate synthase BshA [Opitutales bacterium]MBT5815801.1 N-acetyl-alpha-D-glucosaminyl L-malate synthase BshA [Opitutales bacterium]MBT6380150.1 N-acetyl-alpha-D-glucosaminyl L-malate synthase BshA [Opitutales bacterium]MBT6769335.1 N-acetyl-alpha-D-glucosaminyl L-malate synthase BshA [Opitutales bacterium]